MRIRWRGLELPSQVIRDEEISTDTYGRFIIEPFERGFGTTIGNSLRRILLSSLEGAAVTRVKIAGADHEFTTLPNVMEDVTDIILNIKSLVVRLESDEPKLMRVQASKAGAVTAANIDADPSIVVVNGRQHIATLTAEAKLDIEMTVERGRGYRTADENEGPEQVLGVIPIDSIFSPVTRVRYKTQETRVGQRVNYDRLVLEIWTKGTLTPENALVEAAKILRKHLNPFVQYNEPGDTFTAGEPADETTIDPSGDPELESKLATQIVDLDLSVRASNCLSSANVNTVGDLVRMTEADLLNVRSFGKTSLREIKRKLSEMGLGLGLRLPASLRPSETAEVTH